MNKAFFISIILFFFSTLCIGQNKQDYVWLNGYNYDTFIEGNESFMFDFKEGSSPKTVQGVIPITFFGNNASICDKDGNLLFYTNGCHVADANHEIMPNGSGLNDGIWVEEFMQDTCRDYRGTQDIMILSDPNSEDGNYIIHKTIEIGDPRYRSLRYSYVDQNLNFGNGDVTEKNIVIIDDIELMYSYLTAVKHSNNEDWWIIQPDKINSFQTILLDDQDFRNFGRQSSGAPDFQEFSSASGTAKFSPDGNFYAFYNVYDNLLLYDFDRETGILSNLIQLELARVFPPNVIFSSVEWSPNSRFLYVAIQDELWQVDTWEEDLEDGKVLIDTWNGVQDPFPTNFYLMALAPDCRIYMRSTSGTFSIHVINNPNEKGIACDLVQQGVKLPYPIASMPNFPRFRVDEDDKCDPTITSIFGDDVYYRRDMAVYPNPVRDILTVEIPEGKKGRLVVFDMMGRMVYDDKCPDDKCRGLIQVDLSQLAVGTYSVEFVPEDNSKRLIYTSQIVKVE